MSVNNKNLNKPLQESDVLISLPPIEDGDTAQLPISQMKRKYQNVSILEPMEKGFRNERLPLDDEDYSSDSDEYSTDSYELNESSEHEDEKENFLKYFGLKPVVSRKLLTEENLTYDKIEPEQEKNPSLNKRKRLIEEDQYTKFRKIGENTDEIKMKPLKVLVERGNFIINKNPRPLSLNCENSSERANQSTIGNTRSGPPAGNDGLPSVDEASYNDDKKSIVKWVKAPRQFAATRTCGFPTRKRNICCWKVVQNDDKDY